MKAADICSGAGGASLALETCGWTVTAHAEIDPFACRVLEKRWPDVPNVGDWTSEAGRAAFREAAGEIDLLCGGVPCQGYSAAGKRRGWDDERNLFPALFKLLGEWRDGPPVVLVENVAGLLTAGEGDALLRVVSGFARLGFAVEWDVCSALYAGAPHRRERIWIVARRDGLTTWSREEERAMFPGPPERWPRAGRWSIDGHLTRCEPQWPTPSGPRGGIAWATARNGGHLGSIEHCDLEAQVKALRPWATASARDWKSGQASDETFFGNARPLSEQVERDGQARGRLNPSWVETFMGWPLGQTDLDCDAPEIRPYPLPMAEGDDGEPLYSSSPQAPWEPPRVVEPVRGDDRRARIRCLGNGWEQGTARIVIESITPPTPTEETVVGATRGEANE